MVVINYPEPAFRIRKQQGAEEIFDPLRKKWVVLTPEEWVRQNFIQFILEIKKYPLSLIAVEKEIKLGELKKRFDILVYNSKHEPWLIVECKAMDVLLDEKVLQQALRYNLSVPVSFIIITNGNYTMGWQRGETGLHEITSLPDHI
jgi:hypothetical protein